MNRIDEITKAVNQLPPLSHSAAELISRANDGDLSAEMISDIISKDPSITGQVMRIANSAAFHPASPIVSIQHAVSFLGNRAVMGIVIGHNLSHVYKTPLSGYCAPEGALWKYCLCTAIAARYISKYAKKNVSPELAYTAGLLHAIGKSVLSDFLSKISSTDNRYYREETTFIESELKSLGISHPEVGVAIARRWKLPDEICEPIRWYLQPAMASERVRHIVYIVHLSSFTAMMCGYDTGIDGMNYKLDKQYESFLNISEHADLERIIINVQEEFKIMIQAT